MSAPRIALAPGGAAQVPAVELAQEPDRPFVHLALDLAHEPHQLGARPRRASASADALAGHLAQRPRPSLGAAADHDRRGAGRRRAPRCARARSVMSPEAITGIATRSTSSAVSVWSAVPVYICWAERGCSVSAATPSASSFGPRSSAVREPLRRPRRIFTVTGTSTASTTAASQRAGQVVILERARAGAGLRDLAHRAAEVDVDDVGARGDDHPRRLGHRARVGAEDLHRERVLVGGRCAGTRACARCRTKGRTTTPSRSTRGRLRTAAPGGGTPAPRRPPSARARSATGSRRPRSTSSGHVGSCPHRSGQPSRGAVTPMSEFACLTVEADLTYNPPSLGVRPEISAANCALSADTDFPFIRRT